MRTSVAFFALVVVVACSAAFVACGDNTQQHGGGSMDMAMVLPAPGPDMSPAPAKCNPVDNLTDLPCLSGGGCGDIGTTPVLIGGVCKCYKDCTLQPDCPCDRFCDPVSRADAGAGAVCLPGNGPGERCGLDASGTPHGHGLCQQGLACIASDTAKTFEYCMYLCFGSDSICPEETQCDYVPGPTPFNVCNILHQGASVKMLGDTCVIGTDVCALGSLCDGTTCKTQCDGPSATCAAGTSCTAITDTRLMKILGYVCK
jgi:hypothetical protein